jgi:hypothetical protein
MRYNMAQASGCGCAEETRWILMTTDGYGRQRTVAGLPATDGSLVKLTFESSGSHPMIEVLRPAGIEPLGGYLW